jgi:hypothetical protein
MLTFLSLSSSVAVTDSPQWHIICESPDVIRGSTRVSLLLRRAFKFKGSFSYTGHLELPRWRRKARLYSGKMICLDSVGSIYGRKGAPVQYAQIVSVSPLIRNHLPYSMFTAASQLQISMAG